jgi:copper chaperone NosL
LIRAKQKQKSVKKNKRGTVPATAVIVACFIMLFSCTTKTQPLQLGKDNCDYCRMTISDARFGAEIVTSKGKAYKFDDMHCILSFLKAGGIDTTNSRFYLVDFTNHDLQPATKMFILRSDALRSPMQGNMAAFSSKENLTQALQKFNGSTFTWHEALQIQ